MPHWPYFWNLRWLPMSTAVSFWMKAKRTFLVMLSGSFCPCSSLSLGLGSNRSSWLGAPSLNRKMQALALGANCGGRAASRSGP